MLIMTAKLPRRKLALGALAAAVLCCCALLVGALVPADRQAQAYAAVNTKGIRTNEDRIEFLSEYGWQVKENPVTVEELIVPKEFDESYDEYLSLQAEQGFDLTEYAGKRVKRYTYEITNYPGGEGGIRVNLLVCRNTVIGGEVLSPKVDGFLHGLALPAPEPEPAGAVLS